tara:strand:+ start:696 stop:1391 length:696 start_codon:yes stop_codon:yes gene_type:complete
MNKVIYTAIFGDYDSLEKPKFIPKGFDFVCFTDSNIQSDFWDIRKVLPLYEDSTRNARKYKLLPHRFLPQYDISIWMDGNFLIRNDLNEMVDRYLSDKNFACHDHNNCKLDPRDCVYQEAEAILWLGKNDPNKKFKDEPSVITKQIDGYFNEGYPQNNGLIVSGVLLRRHNEKDVVITMEKWWEQVKYGSKRDQLSFDYSVWKTGLKYNYIEGDIRDNNYFYLLSHNHQKK